VFAGESRQVFRAQLGVDHDTWARGRGWALSLALIAIPYYGTPNPDAVRKAPHVIAETFADFAAEREGHRTGEFCDRRDVVRNPAN
jgi:hypothetical protein